MRGIWIYRVPILTALGVCALLFLFTLSPQAATLPGVTLDEASNKQVYAEFLDRLFPERDPVSLAHVDSLVKAYGVLAGNSSVTLADLGQYIRESHEGIWREYRKKLLEQTAASEAFPK